MCGIAGYLGADLAFGHLQVERACGLLRHRGPDGTAVFQSPGVVLGHRRLAILDLSAAAEQPMTSPDGRFTLVYNGETYNHQALRARFCGNWPFRGHGDAETVLALLALRGPAALEEMVGMWALALWDAREQRLLLSRDRYGQKPLYWRPVDRGLLFASEIRPLLLDGERPRMYRPMVAEYLATGNYGHLGERTFFEDIASLPPGSWASLTPGNARPEPRRYWRFPVDAERRPYDDTARRRFRDGFVEAVHSQLLADVPVGATLSGGIDSSAVVGAIAAGRDTPFPVFTAQTGEGARDESRWVRAVERQWPGRLDLHWFRPQALRLSTDLPAAIRTQEEPFGDPSILAHRALMAEAHRQGVKVVLGGQGADELLFGYPFMTWALIAQGLRRGPRGWALGELRRLEGGRARVLLAALAPDRERRLRLRSRQERRSWLAPSLQAELPAGALASTGEADAVWRETIEASALPHLTHYDDRNGMAESIEGRMPFLDHRLAGLVSGLDPQAFLQAGARKRLLREACAEFLPREVAERRDKIGFYTPLAELLRQEADWVHSLLDDDLTHSLDLFPAGTRPPGSHEVWRALSVRLWAEAFRVEG